MSYVFVAIGGALIGISFIAFLAVKDKTHGVIEVDHDTGQCKVRITSAELADFRTKKAVFKVTHDAKISREEQIL